MDGEVWFWSNGHPDCYPNDVGKGLDARIVVERDAALYFTAMRNFLADPENLRSIERPPPGDTNALLALTYSANAVFIGHPHTQFSEDGKYALFVSDMGNTLRGEPPGGIEPGPYTTDLFLVVMP